MNHLADHARALLVATADSAEGHVKEARASLAAALGGAKSLTSRLYDEASARTRACDQAVHQNPYLVIGIAAGLGTLLGYLAVRECAATRR